MTERSWDHRRYCAAAEAEIAAFADGAREADLDAPVPTCPDWSIAELLRHLGGVHRWGAATVRVGAPRRLSLREIGVSFPTVAGDHLPWFTEGGERLLAILRDADPDAPVWTWGKDQRVRFWSRRMLQETAVHRCDLDIALGRDPEVPAETAADGVDELLGNLESAAVFAPKVENLRGDGETLAFDARDIGARWLFRLLPDHFEWTRHDAPAGGQDADAVVSGGVSDLFLFLWGRRKLGDPHLEFSGDDDLLVHWAENSAI
ncbi:maleylpyruvate isomerase family mycothiol-dependent enzyme [Actinomadura rubrisoli]|uniref:Maleylpyruvate isomerase family mycothiol-dependent enzyme n=1 Tax=Actinomadura rubrisoli TaxID=2530368 RepID=A0A4R5A634_9ACTN|nr:maleylpyruvate isomerase family mycothiol-dependent enzyme [Actinomadura rubrisoli]TDD67473.1 maleylpyruvate isomerase family mycothiol-dependent enzyme [Actinomadura rubrisoli]